MAGLIYGLPIVMNYAVMHEFSDDGSLTLYIQRDSPGLLKVS